MVLPFFFDDQTVGDKFASADRAAPHATH